MTDRSDEDLRRGNARERTKRDLARLRRREPGGGYWRSLALVGSVGWPIVVLATGGALIGRYLDARWSTGVRLTFTLLFVGTSVGTALAFRSLRRSGE